MSTRVPSKSRNNAQSGAGAGRSVESGAMGFLG
jgi:hypothetical protein